MGVFDAKLEIEVGGAYKLVSNVREIALSLLYKPRRDSTICSNDWLVTMDYGGAREFMIDIVGVLSKKQNSGEVQLFDLLMQHYCFSGEQDSAQSGALDKYRLLLSNGKVIEAYCTVVSCELAMSCGKFDEYHARLSSCGLPTYEMS